MHVFGIRLLGVNGTTGEKLLFTVALVAGLVVLRIVLHACARLFVRDVPNATRARFWTHQGINLFSTVLFLLFAISIWFDNAARATTVMGLVGAGIAFALQKFITAIAGYFVILRGKTFNLGDRIVMGGVRGDVVALDFIQTTILEMGQPPSVNPQTDPAVWVMARQFTGRIVTVNNGVIFDEPVYNYSRDFPFLFEEISVGIDYAGDYETAERILLDTVRARTTRIDELSEEAREHLRRVFDLTPPDVEPRVYYRMTSNWVELSVRFLCMTHEIRALKDAIFRELLARFKAHNIGIASSTYDIVGFPPVRVIMDPVPARAPGTPH